jgi:hypothetical protein
MILETATWFASEFGCRRAPGSSANANYPFRVIGTRGEFATSPPSHMKTQRATAVDFFAAAYGLFFPNRSQTSVTRA